MQPSRHKNQGIYLHNPFIVMNGIFHLRRSLRNIIISSGNGSESAEGKRKPQNRINLNSSSEISL